MCDFLLMELLVPAFAPSFLLACLFAALCGLWDLSSLTRDQTQAMARVSTAGPPGNSPAFAPS